MHLIGWSWCSESCMKHIVLLFVWHASCSVCCLQTTCSNWTRTSVCLKTCLFYPDFLWNKSLCPVGMGGRRILFFLWDEVCLGKKPTLLRAFLDFWLHPFTLLNLPERPEAYIYLRLCIYSLKKLFQAVKLPRVFSALRSLETLMCLLESALLVDKLS